MSAIINTKKLWAVRGSELLKNVPLFPDLFFLEKKGTGVRQFKIQRRRGEGGLYMIVYTIQLEA